MPTADTMILGRGTAYQTDAGMCGDYDSVIGMDKLEPVTRFVTGMPKGRFTPAEGEATLCGVFVETDDASGTGGPGGAGSGRRAAGAGGAGPRAGSRRDLSPDPGSAMVRAGPRGRPTKRAH